MSDVGLFIVNNCYDLKLENGDLVLDDTLETAVSISLFTDRRVTDEELPKGQKDKMGWWGDMFPEVDQDKIGSRLWLLRRAKRTTATLRLFEDYCKEALQWLVEDGVASAVKVTAVYDESFYLVGTIVIEKPLGRSSRFALVWDKQQLKAA
jgi:phage gp46-like protein